MTPAHAVGVIVFLYWAYVVAKLIRVRRRSQWRDAAIPRQPFERALWIVWIPLVILWIGLPFVAVNQSPERHPWLAIPEPPEASAAHAVRWLAVLPALAAFLASIGCWRFMGRSWRMAVDDNMTTLLTTGPYRWVRHPIYALSMVLMLSTILAAPSRMLFVVAAVHVSMLALKAANEERFLRRAHGERYVGYASKTGRFLPRLHG